MNAGVLCFSLAMTNSHVMDRDWFGSLYVIQKSASCSPVPFLMV